MDKRREKTEVCNTLKSSGEYVILSNSSPYSNVKLFTNIVESFTDSGIGTILKKEFRYSLDGDTYSEFQELTLDALQTLGSFQEVYFQFRYTLLSGGPITLTKITLIFDSIPPDYSSYVPPRIENEDAVYAYPVIYKSNFLWQPYKMNRAIRLYKDLNLMVNNLFGHDVEYYRVLPQGRSKDVVLMEYSLYEHDEKQCMKLVVPNNEFPDNKLNMGPFGVDFELPFEVQVDKDYYQQVFGAGSGPQKRDVIYFPRTNRIYEVSSSYLFRDFMNEPLYFKITLVKWVPKSNVEQTPDVNGLEEFTVSATSLFGEEKKKEEIKTTNPQQYKVATIVEDPVRHRIDSNQTIEDIKLLNYYTVIAEHFYKMESLTSKPLIKVDVSPSLFVEGETYFARLAPGSTSNESYLSSMRTFIYEGSHENKSIFSYGNGYSDINYVYSVAEIFGPTSSFGLYVNEYSGSTADSPVAGCTASVSSYRKHVVEYNARNEFDSKSDRSYSAWFRLKKNTNPINKILSYQFNIYTRNLTLNFENPILLFKDDLVSVNRSSTSSFLLFGKVVEILSTKSVMIEIDQDILNFVATSFSNWSSYTDLVGQKTFSRVFLNGMKDKKGVKIELYENRHFKISMNESHKYFSMANTTTGLDTETWYGLFINFSNVFRQLTVNVWKMQWDHKTKLPATTDLSIVMNNTVPLSPTDLSSDVRFFLEPSFMDLTNIRWFTRVAETDKQVFILNQNIVKDAQYALIIDNAIPQSRLPLIGYTR